jgi:hypothetical protein
MESLTVIPRRLRARIFELLSSPGIESISPANVTFEEPRN